jgi:hypothetical protein
MIIENEAMIDVIIQPLDVGYVLIKRTALTVLRWEIRTESSLPIRAYVVAAEKAPASPVDYADAFWNRTSVGGVIEGDVPVAILIRNDFATPARYTATISLEPAATSSSIPTPFSTPTPSLGATSLLTGLPMTEVPSSTEAGRVAIIAGGVVGGVIAVALLAGVVYYCLRRRGTGDSSGQSSRLLVF